MNPRLAAGLYFALQRLRGEPVDESLRDVTRLEHASEDELRAVQSRRQLEQLRFAVRHVPRYRRTITPWVGAIESARNWDDVDELLRALPILEKGSVMDDPADFRADGIAALRTHPNKTSGSSGTPVYFPCDQTSWAYRHALVYRTMKAFGVEVGERYALFFGLHWDRQARAKVWLRDRVLNRVRISAYEVGAARFGAHLRAIRRAAPTHFLGYPSAIYEFCALAREHGVELRELRLKAIFTTAEPLRPHQRTLIQEVTSSRCIDMYGGAEGGVLALECPAGGLHLTPEATWLQVREPGSTEGEAIVTDMFLRAFPMIRYAMGDHVVLRAGACACGRKQPLLASVEGRSGEPIALPNGRRINANLPSYIFKPLAELGVIRRYRFVQYGASELELLLVVAREFSSAHRATVEREIRRAFGEDVPVRIQLVAELPHLPNAKHRDYVHLPARAAQAG